MRSSPFDAEAWLGLLDPIGWRFGLERIEALLTELERPQHAFEPIHVVGTNGKSSVTAMTAALVEASGRPTGCFLSPHDERWAERVRIGSRGVEPEAFEDAAADVATAIKAVERGFAGDERITQFEASTAVAFVCLARAGVEVGVIEAGLGGRLDATNVLRSKATVLTSIGLDHTAWLGETEAQIAGEKLAVLRPGSVLVLGPTSPAVAELARQSAADRGCRVVGPASVPDGIDVAAPYLRRNLGVALAAAEVVLGEAPGVDAMRAVAEVRLPGRFDVRDGEPPVILDAAHNPDGAMALAEALALRYGDRAIIGCLAVLADKDADGIVAALAPALRGAVCTEIPVERLQGVGRPGAASVPASELARLCEAHGVPAEVEDDPSDAVAKAKSLALERGGVALIAGSHYLLAY